MVVKSHEREWYFQIILNKLPGHRAYIEAFETNMTLTGVWTTPWEARARTSSAARGVARRLRSARTSSLGLSGPLPRLKAFKTSQSALARQSAALASEQVEEGVVMSLVRRLDICSLAMRLASSLA